MRYGRVGFRTGKACDGDSVDTNVKIRSDRADRRVVRGAAIEELFDLLYGSDGICDRPYLGRSGLNRSGARQQCRGHASLKKRCHVLTPTGLACLRSESERGLTGSQSFTKYAILAKCDIDARRHASLGKWELSRSGHSFLASCSLLLGGRLAVALLEVGEDDRKHELLFTVLVELNGNVLFVAGKDGTKSELGVFDLRALRESWFGCHGVGCCCLNSMVTFLPQNVEGGGGSGWATKPNSGQSGGSMYRLTRSISD
jgi:hypothetical protein